MNVYEVLDCFCPVAQGNERSRERCVCADMGRRGGGGAEPPMEAWNAFRSTQRGETKEGTVPPTN